MHISYENKPAVALCGDDATPPYEWHVTEPACPACVNVLLLDRAGILTRADRDRDLLREITRALLTLPDAALLAWVHESREALEADDE